ncbi:MAG: PorT family protein, partial [Bacteroidales bacterium]|nr:PorT family protein [Bacteroidales bacterium]
ISIGVKLLPGISKSVGLVETNFKFSIEGGVQFVTNFNKVIGIESGLYYRNLGYILDEDLTDISGELIGSFRIPYNYNYLSLPVLLRLNIHSFYFALGANLNLFLSGTKNMQGQYIQGIQVNKVDIENAKKFVIDPGFNCGYQFNLNNKFGINLEGRFSYSVNGILEDYNEMQFINIGLGVGFCYFINPME